MGLKSKQDRQTEHREVKGGVMAGGEDDETKHKHEEYTYGHEGRSGAEGGVGEKEGCGGEEKMEGGGS